MDNNKIIIAFVTFFAIIITFSGAVSATNWTVNPGGNIQSTINSE